MAGVLRMDNHDTDMLDKGAFDVEVAALSSRVEVDGDRNDMEVAALSHHLL